MSFVEKPTHPNRGKLTKLDANDPVVKTSTKLTNKILDRIIKNPKKFSRFGSPLDRHKGAAGAKVTLPSPQPKASVPEGTTPSSRVKYLRGKDKNWPRATLFPRKRAAEDDGEEEEEEEDGELGVDPEIQAGRQARKRRRTEKSDEETCAFTTVKGRKSRALERAETPRATKTKNVALTLAQKLFPSVSPPAARVKPRITLKINPSKMALAKDEPTDGTSAAAAGLFSARVGKVKQEPDSPSVLDTIPTCAPSQSSDEYSSGDEFETTAYASSTSGSDGSSEDDLEEASSLKDEDESDDNEELLGHKAVKDEEDADDEAELFPKWAVVAKTLDDGRVVHGRVRRRAWTYKKDGKTMLRLDCNR